VLAREAALRRLAALVDPALRVMAAALTTDRSDGLARRLKLSAAKDLLDRRSTVNEITKLDKWEMREWLIKDVKTFRELRERIPPSPPT